MTIKKEWRMEWSRKTTWGTPFYEWAIGRREEIHLRSDDAAAGDDDTGRGEGHWDSSKQVANEQRGYEQPATKNKLDKLRKGR